jgi:hypothetical protein
MKLTYGALGTVQKRRELLLAEIASMTLPVIRTLRDAVTDVFKETSLESTDDRMGAVVRHLIEHGSVSHEYTRTRHSDLDILKTRFQRVQTAWSGNVDVTILDMGDTITVQYKAIYPKE